MKYFKCDKCEGTGKVLQASYPSWAGARKVLCGQCYGDGKITDRRIKCQDMKVLNGK